MPQRFHLFPVPATREPISILSVDRAISDIRRGHLVAIRGSHGYASLMLAAEAATLQSLDKLAELSSAEPSLAITGRRATVLGLTSSALKVAILSAANGLNADLVHDLSDPLSRLTMPTSHELSVFESSTFSCESAAVMLTKTARLLPAAVCAPIRDPDADDLDAWAIRHGLLLVDAGDVFQYDHTASRSLRPVSEARVPLAGAEDARVVAFRPLDGGLEHLAVLIGAPNTESAVLTRLHSECFTGDLLGSLRCDCGDQLRGAIREISAAGGGILLYLAQEGRGIGLVNKLRAYELQDRGFDTLDANEQLGFDADERVYLPAAQMLRQLGFNRVRLLTNNPAKVDGLSHCGITIEKRVPHAFPSNQHNETYMRTKVGKGGHLL